MWVVDGNGGLVNLDNAVRIGVADAMSEDTDLAAPEAGPWTALVAHMVDGTTVTLLAGEESVVTGGLHDLRNEWSVFDLTRRASVDRELASRMRHGDG